MENSYLGQSLFRGIFRFLKIFNGVAKQTEEEPKVIQKATKEQKYITLSVLQFNDTSRKLKL